jgi:BirA family biotin operon repressor/biotin-[acetyl-CoA-carboxylase] ligase
VNEWRHADALHGVAVRVMVGETIHKGLARGIDAGGALMLETPGGLLRFISGEVSLRPEA